MLADQSKNPALLLVSNSLSTFYGNCHLTSSVLSKSSKSLFLNKVTSDAIKIEPQTVVKHYCVWFHFYCIRRYLTNFQGYKCKFKNGMIPLCQRIQGRCFVLLNKLQSEKKQQDEYCAKTMFEFSCQTFCILRSMQRKSHSSSLFCWFREVVACMGIENSI